MGDIVQIIHLDGPDKSGKDSIKREIIKRTGGEVMVIARSFLSQTVYASIYGRDMNSEGYWLKAMEAFKRGETLVYLRPHKNLDEIKKRFEEHDEKDMDFANYTLHRTWFDRTVHLLKIQGCRYIEIDTTANDISKCVDIILHKALSDYTKFCSECLLHSLDVNKMDGKHGKGKLLPMYNKEVDFMIVGANPSNERLPYNRYPLELIKANEATHKNWPFWNAFEELGISDKVYITNAVKCSTKNNKLKTIDFKCCWHIIEAEIAFMNPRKIVAIGEEVASYLKAKLNNPIDIIQVETPFKDQSEYVKHIVNNLRDHV
tara:strand:- start:273 stop:1223 length:951 start_codon:yes stop_codon:yes gene_type:complete